LSSISCQCACHHTTGGMPSGCFLCQGSHNPLNYGTPIPGSYTISDPEQLNRIESLLKEIRDLLKKP